MAMAGRRALLGLMLLSAAVHAFGMTREPLPAQDGLKFLRVARRFQTQPWAEVIRGSDQHPLYPALVALAEPGVAALLGPGPDAWRIAAQLVSAAAAVLLLIPLFGLASALFGPRVGVLTCFLWVLLPLPAEIGHDTLADSLALLCLATALRCGEYAVRAGSARAALGCGLAAGLGYLARPELAVVPAAVGVVAAAGLRRDAIDRAGLLRIAAIGLGFLAFVGAYASVKGTVSEKLSLRLGVGLAASHAASRAEPPALPAGLDGPGWDFSPKEEEDEGLRGRPAAVVARLGFRWAETLGFVLVPFALFGLARGESGPGRRIMAAYAVLFAVLACRHATNLGYLSGRHTLSLALVAMPWAAAGYVAFSKALAARRGWPEAGTARRRAVVAGLALAAGLGVQSIKPGHPSRWGHLQAGHWLERNAGGSDAVLDTRGWARFVSGRPGYDYWHVRQALADRDLAFVVVGRDELDAESPRGETLRAVLGHAGERVAAFPSREGGRDEAVQVFRFRDPGSWADLGRRVALDQPGGARR